MILKTIRFALPLASVAVASLALAGEDPRHERHELMEGVGDAAKPLGAMLKGEKDYDAEVAMNSFKTFEAASNKLGDLFPPVYSYLREARQNNCSEKEVRKELQALVGRDRLNDCLCVDELVYTEQYG